MSEATQPSSKPRFDEGTTVHRLRQRLTSQILHLNDSPHRIAFGVGLGFFVGATPTLGAQMIIYVALATLVGANKVSGILPVWISNPVTAVPLYYGNWWLGRWLLTGETVSSSTTRAEITDAIRVSAEESVWTWLFEPEVWRTLLDKAGELGLELWVGSVVVGMLTGATAYWFTRGAVARYRERRQEPPDAPPAVS